MRWPFFPIVSCALMMNLVLTVVVQVMIDHVHEVDVEKYLSEHRQFVLDWNTQPYVDVEVAGAEIGCSAGYEPLLSHEWAGTKALCKTTFPLN